MSKKNDEKKYTVSDVALGDVESMATMHAQSWLETYPNPDAGVPYEWVKERVDGWFQPEKLVMRKDRVTQSASDPNIVWRVAKAEDGRLTSHPSVIELGAFLEQLTNDLRLVAEKKGLFVEFIIGASARRDGVH